MIVTACRAHAALMASVHARAFAPGAQWSAETFAAQLALPGVFGLVDPAGGIALARVAADEAEILTLAVIPAARRRGLGRALLAASASRAQALGAQRLFLEVSADNEAARALYVESGFRAVGRRRRYYPDGSDALVLAAPLGRDVL